MSYATLLRKESDTSAGKAKATKTSASSGPRTGYPDDGFQQQDHAVPKIERLAISRNAATERAAVSATPRSSAQSASARLLQRKCTCGGTPGASGECEECRKKRQVGMLQRKGAQPSTLNHQHSEVPSIVHEVLRSPGQQLDAGTRAFMEPRFGHDFSQVRVHADARAAESARTVRASAYTVGQDIVFGWENFSPSTHHGRDLLGHELAHTIQQRNLVSASPSPASNELETSAEAAGHAVAAGQSVSPNLPACGVGLARQLATPTVYNDQDLARAIQETSVRLKQASYPGRDGDVDWMRQLQTEAARRAKLKPAPAVMPPKTTTPSKPPPRDPAAERAAAVAEAQAAAAQIDQNQKTEDEDEEPAVTPMAIAGQKYDPKAAAKTVAKRPHRKAPDPAMAKFMPGGFSDDDIYKESDEARKRMDEQIAKDREISKTPYEERLRTVRIKLQKKMDIELSRNEAFSRMTGAEVWSEGINDGLFIESEKQAVYEDQKSKQQYLQEQMEEDRKHAMAKFLSDKELAWEHEGDQLRAPQGIIQPVLVAAAAPELVAAAYFGTQTGAMVGDMVNACKNGVTTDCAEATAKVVAAVATERALKGKSGESPKAPPPENPDLTFPRGTDVTNRSAFPPGEEPIPSPRAPEVPVEASTPKTTASPDIKTTLKSLGIVEEEAAQFPTGVKIWGQTMRGGSRLVTYFKLQAGKLTAGVLSAELPKIKGMTPAQVAAAEQSNVIKAFLGFRQQSMSLAKQLGANTLRVEADVVINPDLPESLTKAGFQPIPENPGSFFKEEPVN